MISTALITIALAQGAHFQTDVYQVRSVNRTVHFAGRLGDRVDDRLTVEKDGKSYVVVIGHRHTRFGPVPAFSEGERLRIGGVIRADRIEALPSDVKRVKS